MKLYIAEQKAQELMTSHGLTDWKFLWDKASSRFGCCKFRTKTITMSAALTSLNDEEHVINTILHEIAHALVGPHNGHGVTWRRKAIQIGCTGQRYYSPEVVKPLPAYKVTCNNCGKVTHRARKQKTVACGNCCKAYNNGRWSKEFVLTYVRVN